jgi:putative sigma-54 modulation protein
MQVQITGKRMELTDPLKAYAEEKVRKITRYLPLATEALVTLSVEKHRHVAEVLIRVNRHLIQAEEETDEMYASLDLVMDKIERQVKKYKEKLTNHKPRPGEGAPASGGPPQAEASEEEIPRIIKTKRFAMKPMSPEEAVMQMDLLHKPFFVFTNDRNGLINVIYKRRDGHVGLIEPA